MNAYRMNLQQIIKDQQFRNKIIPQLANLVKNKEKSIFNKKSLKKVRIRLLKIGSEFATEQQMKILYSYLDPKNSHIIKQQDFYRMIQACLQLYIQAKKEPMGGIIKRLILKIRNNTLRQNHKQVKEIIDHVNL